MLGRCSWIGMGLFWGWQCLDYWTAALVSLVKVSMALRFVCAEFSTFIEL